MAGPDTAEEVVVEDVSEEEALRQMEEAFLAGPGGQSDSAASNLAPGKVAEQDEQESAEGTQDTPVTQGGSEGVDATSAETPQTTEAVAAGLSEDKVLELLKTSQITEELRASIKKLQDTTFGKVGGLERTLKALQEGLSAPGEETDIAEHFAELREQYPDAAPLIIKGIQKAMKKAKSIAITTAEPTNTETLVQQLLPVLQEQVDVQFVTRVLDREHKGWRAIVGEKDSKTEFRQWLSTKPAEESAAVLNSYDAELLSSTLAEFKESKKSKAQPTTPAPSTRTSRIEQAVTAKGNLKPPTPRQKTAEEEMEEGFSAGPAGSRR